MKAQDLLEAERLWGVLDDAARQVAKTSLASQLRATGIESTLRWLDGKSPALRDALCGALSVPTERGARGQRANVDVLTASRRALALAEALHLAARVR